MNEFIACVETEFNSKRTIEHIYIDIDKMIEERKTVYDIIHERLEDINDGFCSCSFNESQNYCDCDCGDWSGDFKILSKHQLIGLKDVNNLDVIPDCSIFEFEHKYLDSNIQRYGYFHYNNELTRYDIITRYISKNENLQWPIVHSNDIKNIKIIDTIQENKLGLIK